MSILLPKLIREKLKEYESFDRWKDDNQKMIREFRQKTCFIDDWWDVCDQDGSKYLGYKNSAGDATIELIVDLHNDEIQRFSYKMNHYIFNFVNGTRQENAYKSKKHFYSSGCNCTDGICKDIYDCPTN